jgi:hypothetical protein
VEVLKDEAGLHASLRPGAALYRSLLAVALRRKQRPLAKIEAAQQQFFREM